ncbi:MAG: magnesium/cobalt transporter CorA [Cyanobium sp.]
MAKTRLKATPKDQTRGRGKAHCLSPGTAVFIGERKLSEAEIHLFVYDAATLREARGVGQADWRAARDGPGVVWINVSGVHDVELIEQLGQDFGLHPLTTEDIANTCQRPKWEEFPDYAFIALKMIECQAGEANVKVEHVSLILGRNYVISFLEDEGDVFESVRQRLRRGAGRVRSKQADYLAFCLMDAVVDHYFLTVERIGDLVEELDEQLLGNVRQEDIPQLHRFKRNLLNLRRAIWPLREVLAAISRSETPLLQKENQLYWRDLYDHSVQVIDMVETARDTLASMHDTYLSSLSNRMNEVMKILTIISTIFIPLTFIAGVYGMNFKNMPELEWKDGYFLVLVVMLAIGTSLIVYFRRRRWL